ncbi:YdbL family protein [Phenylobacterium sp.]|uniref:YdbL family protein n=1 Tax=Phenylobacterium sp. TaxID=1871053 RepID=UPI0025F36B16|nr:YdbL family protein [Phenylobacterium sp.]
MRDHFNIAAAVLAALAVTPAAAYAMDSKAAVDAAKAQGVVGEQADGFLGFVKPSSDPALKAAVEDINQGRAALYREAAAKNGVSVEAAGASAYSTVVQSRIKPGEYYKPAGGGWVKK